MKLGSVGIPWVPLRWSGIVFFRRFYKHFAPPEPFVVSRLLLPVPSLLWFRGDLKKLTTEHTEHTEDTEDTEKENQLQKDL